MIKFALVDGRVVIQPEHLLVKELRDIWENDPGPKKELAFKELAYVFIMADVSPSNTFRSRPYYELPDLARVNAFRDRDYKISDAQRVRLEAAIEAYTANNELVDQRLVDTMNRKIEQIRQKLEDEDMVKTNQGDQIDWLIKIDKICVARDNIKSRIEKQETENLKLRGGAQLSLLESGKVGRPVKKREPRSDLST